MGHGLFGNIFPRSVILGKKGENRGRTDKEK